MVGRAEMKKKKEKTLKLPDEYDQCVHVHSSCSMASPISVPTYIASVALFGAPHHRFVHINCGRYCGYTDQSLAR